jgi:uncharacterized protein
MTSAHPNPRHVVDADSHVVEPADLWVSRVPRRLADDVPHVARHPETGHRHWRVGATFLWPVGYFGVAGTEDQVTGTVRDYDELDPATFDPVQRLRRMDEYGVDVQILYPNVIGFQAPQFIRMAPELSVLCTQAYNDFILDWCSADPARLIPIAMLPFWDMEALVAEMERCAGRGHRGVLFANKLEKIGLPPFSDGYWDPVYRAAQSLGLPINYHVGFFEPDMSIGLGGKQGWNTGPSVEAIRASRARIATASFFSLGDVIGNLVTSGLCDRFPELGFVTVESGFGLVPWYLETLDWHWKAFGNRSKLLPSEYFKRQCYGTFWFEKTTLGLLEQFPDNFMFSTDFPHGTSLSPGPASPASLPSAHLDEAFASIRPDIAAKAISGNATRLYRL